MNVLVLGGLTGFGNYFAIKLGSEAHNVLAIGRANLDLDSGWVIPLREKIVHRFKSPDYVDMIVINVYDHRQDKQDVQSRVLAVIWDLFRTQNVTIVVVGSTAYHYSKSVYAMAKKRLAEQCATYGNTFNKAKLILVEPGVLENGRKQQPTAQWLKFETFAEAIQGLKRNPVRYQHLVIKGQEPATPLPKEGDD